MVTASEMCSSVRSLSHPPSSWEKEVFPRSKGAPMRAVRAHDREAAVDSLIAEDAPYPYAGEGDVIVKVRAACFTPNELGWPASCPPPP